MNQISKQNLTVPDSLDAVTFFHCLVKEGCRLSHISSAHLEALQLQIVELLTEQFNRRTSGQSSSVPVETGQCIQQSVFFTIGYFLKSLSGAENALEALKNNRLQELFHKGKKLVEKDLIGAKELLQAVQEGRFPTDVIAYNDTLDEGLPMFFSSYDMDYEAHETPAFIDYPLSSDKMNLTGIDYIYDYLQKLHLENEFCSCFSNEEIHCLLRSYDRRYQELLVNIFDLVLVNAIGSLLLGRDEISLHLSDYDRRYLQQTLSEFPSGRLGKPVDKAVSLLCRRLSIADPLQLDYIKTSAVKLKSRLQSAMESGIPDHLFLSTEDTAEEPVIRFEDKAKLDQDSFRRLADEIRECRLISDKLILLHGEPLSMTDLTDLLEGSCFFEDEFQQVFQSLEEIQLALLVKKLPFDPDGSGFLDEESSREWQIWLNRFLTRMEPRRKSAILTLAGRIENTSLFG